MVVFDTDRCYQILHIILTKIALKGFVSNQLRSIIVCCYKNMLVSIETIETITEIGWNSHFDLFFLKSCIHIFIFLSVCNT